MARSDEELMLSCGDGDESAFETLYHRYEKPVLSFIYRMTNSTSDAEDLCQETFFKVVRAKRRYRAKGKFKTWLFRVALNLCRDRIRRMKFRSHTSLDSPEIFPDGESNQSYEHLFGSSPDPAQRAEVQEMKSMVRGAFAALTQDQKTVVILRQYHDLKFPEIAEIMKCPVGTVKSLNYRGHQRLLEILSAYLE
jgi:RNA polymerase sigma-70 factor (ECF subfamily)